MTRAIKPTPDWRIAEIREECAEQSISGAANLPAELARFIVEIIDGRSDARAALRELVRCLDGDFRKAPTERQQKALEFADRVLGDA